MIKIGDIEITKNGKPIFIADIAANHDGDINRAFKLIELAKEAGADVAKFQNFKASKIVSKNAFDQMPKQTHQKEFFFYPFFLPKKAVTLFNDFNAFCG